MYLDKLPGLQKKLLESKDFGDIFEYFFEELGSDRAFAMSGEPTKDARILKSLATAVCHATGDYGALVGNAFRIASHRFVHGSFSFGTKWTVLMFYFEEINTGFVAVGDHRGPSRFSRFSAIDTPDGKPPTVH